jgi:hypothetical protein
MMWKKLEKQESSTYATYNRLRITTVNQFCERKDQICQPNVERCICRENAPRFDTVLLRRIVCVDTVMMWKS